MSVPIDVDLTQEAGKRAKAELKDWLAPELIARNIGPEGQTYGSSLVDRADRILMFIEDRENGVHDRWVNGVFVQGTLRVVNPDLEDEMQKQFEEDIAHSPLFGHTQTDDSIRESGATTAFDSPLEGII